MGKIKKHQFNKVLLWKLLWNENEHRNYIKKMFIINKQHTSNINNSIPSIYNHDNFFF